MLLGNHLDAWVFGAIDPSSGTAVMKEVSRVMGNLVQKSKGKFIFIIIHIYIFFLIYRVQSYWLIFLSWKLRQNLNNLFREMASSKNHYILWMGCRRIQTHRVYRMGWGILLSPLLNSWNFINYDTRYLQWESNNCRRCSTLSMIVY